MVDYSFLSNGRFLPRLKESIARLAEIDPDLAQLTRAYYHASDVQTQAQLADTLARRILGVTEFFEWESEIEAMQQ